MSTSKYSGLFLALIVAFGLMGCLEEADLPGTLKVAITNSSIDSEDIASVNLFITNMEGLQEGNWKSFQNFESPLGVNLLSLAGSKSLLIVNQPVNPGEFSDLRLTLKMAVRNSSLIINPQSNMVFSNGSTVPLFLPTGASPQIILPHKTGISSRKTTNITLDFDLRKSIRKNDQGEYLLNPFIRIINTDQSGHIKIIITNTPVPTGMVVYAYAPGTFRASEISGTEDMVSFSNAITSAEVNKDQCELGFLETGQYDLVFVRHNQGGLAVELLGKINEVEVRALQKNQVEISLEQLDPS